MLKYFYYKLQYTYLKWYRNIHFAKNLNKYIRLNPDIKLFIDYAGETTNYINKVNRNIHKIRWVHGSFSQTKPRILKKIEKSLEYFDCIIAICNEMGNEMINYFPSYKNKIKVIYNPIDFNRIDLLLKQYVLNDEEKLLLNESYLLAVGRLNKQKDYRTMLNAFEILMKRGRPQRLYIIGDGEEKENIQKLIEDKHLEEYVFLLGTKLNPYVWMKHAKLFIHSAKLEGFCLVLIEAMYCEVPVITTRHHCGADEILNDGECGIGYEVGDYEKLAACIIQLLDNPRQCVDYVEKAKLHIRKFAPEVIFPQYESLIEKFC